MKRRREGSPQILPKFPSLTSSPLVLDPPSEDANRGGEEETRGERSQGSRWVTEREVFALLHHLKDLTGKHDVQLRPLSIVWIQSFMISVRGEVRGHDDVGGNSSVAHSHCKNTLYS